MRFRANVRAASGKTKHFQGELVAGDPGKTAELPLPHFVEIVEEDGGFYLYRYDSTSRCIADTWHTSMEEAKEQAKFEYEILESDWDTRPN